MFRHMIGWIFFIGCNSAFTWDTQAYQNFWNQLQHHPKALQKFLIDMPKGADLHLHASGAVSTEKLIAIAQKQHLCMDQQFNISLPLEGKCLNSEDTERLLQSSYFRTKTLQAWSMENFKAQNGQDGKSHFFQTFQKMGPLPSKNWPEVIADVVDKAYEQHLLYLELMLSMHGIKPNIHFSSTEHHIGDVLHHPQFHRYIKNNVKYFRHLKKQVQVYTPYLGSQIEVSWILEIKRDQPFNQFWVDAVMAYAIANQVRDIVAVNLVQPEYEGYAKDDYVKQMQFLNLLSRYFPRVKLVLHAGEVPIQAAQTNVKDHMLIALDYLHPQRIGHGADILYERTPNQIFSILKNKDIAVEINLTSNEQILGIKNEHHPLRSYLNHRVPVVISSDDPGVSRNHLSHEYYKAVTEQKLSLQELIQANRNSLTYSLLKGRSLWSDASTATPVKVCQNLNAQRCLAYVSQNPKAYYQWRLEQDLRLFFFKEFKKLF